MKFTLLILAVTGFVAAQNLGGEPQCALPCLKTAIEGSGCGLTDIGCQCGPGLSKITNNATSCILTNCVASELSVAASVGAAKCSAFAASASTSTGAGAGVTGTASSNATLTSSTSTLVTPIPTTGTLVINGTATTGTYYLNSTSLSVSTTAKPSTSTTTKVTTTSEGTTKTGSGSETGSSTSSSKGGAPTMMAGIGLGGVVGVLGAAFAVL